MDDLRFDRLTRTLATGPSRRRLLGALLGTAFAGHLDRPKIAAKKKNNKNKKKKKQCPFGRPRCGNECCLLEETCRQGRCKHRCEDGLRNLGETDKDCGRVCDGVLGISPAGRCGLRKRCEVNEDCASAKCQEPQPGAGLQCVECLIDSDCTSPIFRRCLDNFCFECAIDADCPSPFGSAAERLCVVIDACPRNQPCVCRQCRQDGDCLSPERPHCNTGTDDIDGKLCNECLEDAHCPAARPHCGENERCFECLEDTDCPQGQLCDEQGNCDEAGCIPLGGSCTRFPDGSDNCCDPDSTGCTEGVCVD